MAVPLRNSEGCVWIVSSSATVSVTYALAKEKVSVHDVVHSFMLRKDKEGANARCGSAYARAVGDPVSKRGS